MKKMKIRNREQVCLVLCFSILLTLLTPMSVSAQEANPETIRVGWYEDSYHISGENGERSGYAYEYEQAVAAYTGWDYEYVKGDWGELLGKLQSGEIDMMAALSYTEERAQTMLFSDLPMGTERYYLYADLTNTDISATDLKTLNGKRIAVLEESVHETQFSAWEAEHDIKTKHIGIDSFEQVMDMIANHEIDGVISTETPILVEAGMSALVYVGGSGIYYGISKSRPDLKEELDSAMRAMENDKPFYADELYERYLSAQSAAFLSNEEKEWIEQHGDIRIGWIYNDSGVSSYDKKTGKITGVINDYVIYARDCLGDQELSFELIGFDSEEEQIQALKDGKIDMIFHAGQNPYYAEQNGLALSNTAFTLSLAVVTTQNSFDESADNVVAVTKDDLKLKWYISYNYPNWEIIECDSDKDAEKLVRNEEADCFLVRSAQVIQYVDDRELHSTFLTKPCNVTFAISKGNIHLMSILNKTLESIQTSKLSGAVTAYEDALNKITLADIVRDNFALFGVVLLLILGAILWALQKAKIAEAKAKEAMVQAENANAAKSLFLFNMSHDIRTPMNAILGYNRLMKKDLTDPRLLDYQEKIEQSGTLLLSIINNVLDMARIESGKVEIDENYEQAGDILKEVCEVFEGEAAKKDIKLEYETTVEHKHIMCDIAKIREIYTNLISNAIKYTPCGGRVTVKIEEIPCDRKGYINLKAQVIDNGIGMSKEYLPSLYESFTRENNTTSGKVAGTGLGMPIVKRLVDLMGGSITVESELGKGTTFTVILQHKIADEAYYESQKTDPSEDSKNELLSGKHILLAEDNDLNAEIATMILKDMGLAVDRVEDGIQCIAQLDKMPADTYDLILMDIQMPNMDGYKATENIRKFPAKEKANIPIIAMTANAFEEDKRTALSKGMNGHIAKPIDAAKVTEVLIRFTAMPET